MPEAGARLIQKAQRFAQARHRGQWRKGKREPFIVHPKAVGQLLARSGMPASVVAAGWLHDVLEDTPTTARELTQQFGRQVTGWVQEVTEPNKKFSWEVRKAAHLKHLLGASREALAIACADKLHNTLSLAQAYQKEGPVAFGRFRRSIDKKLSQDRKVFRTIRRRWSNCPGLDRLDRELTHLEKIVSQFRVPQNREVETKFVLKTEALYNRLQALESLGKLKRVSRRREQQVNRYFDTQGFKLRQAHAALKVREVGRRKELTFKSEIAFVRGVSERIEVTVPLKQLPSPRFFNGPARNEPLQYARKIIGNKNLWTVMTLETDRTRLIFGPKSRRVELDLDRVTLLRGKQFVATHLEAELENVTSSVQDYRKALQALIRILGGKVRPSRLSKYEIGFRKLKRRA